MEQERARADALGYTDPINASYEATTEMYHKTLTECLRRIKVRKWVTRVFSIQKIEFHWLCIFVAVVERQRRRCEENWYYGRIT